MFFNVLTYVDFAKYETPLLRYTDSIKIGFSQNEIFDVSIIFAT
jgi:hypothetical protein